jgi:hypothetical protein
VDGSKRGLRAIESLELSSGACEPKAKIESDQRQLALKHDSTGSNHDCSDDEIVISTSHGLA